MSGIGAYGDGAVTELGAAQGGGRGDGRLADAALASIDYYPRSLTGKMQDRRTYLNDCFADRY